MSHNQLGLAALISAALLILATFAPIPLEWRVFVTFPTGAVTLWVGFLMFRRSQRPPSKRTDNDG